MSKKKSSILLGTIILTLTGFISRIIGFFYRIFLSNTIGEEGMGIYQLIFPISSICFALCAASYQTAISRFVASHCATSNQSKKNQKTVLRAGLLLTIFSSLIVSAILYVFATPIANYVILEPRCASLVKMLALSVPFASTHSCIAGYYYGQKKTGVPAFSQLVEQCIRVCSVWLIWNIRLDQRIALSPTDIMIGTLASDIITTLFMSICFFITEFEQPKKTIPSTTLHTIPMIKQILLLAIPLTANRLFISVLQSVEAIMIPSRLRMFGLTSEQSLSIYGVLTGMAFPFIFFPSALTNSVSVMLLPEIAGAQASNNYEKIQKATNRGIDFCLWLGIFCTGLFLIFGNDMGVFVFDSELAGRYITILGWLCPFMYLASTMGSILNGLGMTSTTFFHNMVSLTIRLFFVVFLIPKFSILAYLWGTLLSQLLVAFLHLHTLYKKINFHFSSILSIVVPTVLTVISGYIALFFKHNIQHIISSPILQLLACLCIMSGSFVILGCVYFSFTKNNSPFKKE